MADMRLIVAGAGGRMGRALARVIAETPGAVQTGALEAPGSDERVWELDVTESPADLVAELVARAST